MNGNLETLGYLHDATVIGIRFTMANDGKRRVAIECICHEDAGFDLWNGKRLEVLLDDVRLLEQMLYGFTSSREEVSGWVFSLPDAMEQEMERLQKLGIDCSGIKFELDFQSGSFLRGVCRQIDVHVESGEE